MVTEQSYVPDVTKLPAKSVHLQAVLAEAPVIENS